ncbi:unnamed protein product [Adineta ricciae]|uniref:G-protein coupled receptors family 1 profile domain-containing protein n=1 Tax=Adineta ricciae TaxID=249248 RepID=A0A815AS67_ADIRI|nr:unnamed protein product [Adineta ricciae]CAF1260850.1 unnamed protein product [Adineta ricciae]
MTLSLIIKFWFCLIFIIPSMLCSIFNLYYFLIDRTFRQNLHNHVITIILLFGFIYMITDIIWLIHYYRTNSLISSTRTFCLLWISVDLSGYASIMILTAWASIERHIFIFHQNLLSTSLKRFIFHYLPLIICSIYPSTFYFIGFFALPCTIPSNYHHERCQLGFCLSIHEILGTWDSSINNILPIFVIVIFSIGLIIRIWHKKYRIGQRFQWKKYKKMTFQLLSLSALYLLLVLPSQILYTAYTFGLSSDIGWDFFLDSYYFSYFTMLFTPFVSIASLPELRTKFRKIIQFSQRQQNTIAPEIREMSRIKNRRVDRRTGTVQ